MKGQKRKMHKHNFFRGIALALVMTLVVTMCPFPNGNYAYADTSTLVTEQPEIVVTGSGVIGGDSYTGDNVGYEKAYTRSELKAMSGGTDVLYSSIKSQSPYTKQLTRATGVYVSSLLSGTKVDLANDKVSFIAADTFAVHFDPNAAYESGDRTTTSLAEIRYTYPGLLEGSDADYTEVQAMLAWAMASGSKDPGTAGSEADSLRLAVGQLNFEDMNNQLYNKEVRTILSGNTLTETVLTVGDKAYTRSEVLLMARAERTYNYSGSSGDKTDTVVGVPMSVLLDGHKDSDIVTFGSADNYPVTATGMTVKELIDGNYMLAYEKNGNGIYETAKNNTSIYGFLTLYGDGAKPAKLVNNISVESSGGSEGTDTPEDPVTPPAGDTVGDATAETATISFVGEGLVKEGFFSISGLKNADGIEKGEFAFKWMNSSSTTGESTVEGAEMKNILKDILGLTDEADTIKFISSDGQETTMALDDMFVKDKNGQRPVLAWKLDGTKCDPRLIVGQADENDQNRGKWVKDIVKVEVTASSGSEEPENPPAGDTVGDATAETAVISFVGNGFEKEGFFSISGLKNAQGIEKGEFSFDWMNSVGITGTSVVEGAEMRNILKSVLQITEDANKITFISSDGRATTMDLDDMFVKDKNGQRPVLAWKEDGAKCDPKLIIGQADANDINKTKWAKDIVKIEVTEPEGFDYSKSPYKHINNGGLTDYNVYNIDAITGATLTVEGPGVEKLVAKSVRDLETEEKGIFRGIFKDVRAGVETERTYEGIDLYHILNNMYSVNEDTGNKDGIILNGHAKKVQIKNRNRVTIAEFTMDQVKEAHDAGKPILVAYGTAYADGGSAAPFVFDNGTNMAPKDLGNEDGCLKLVYDKSSITGDKNNSYTKFTNMAYIYVADDVTPGYKHDEEPYDSTDYSEYIVTITGDKIGREVNYTVKQLEDMVKYDSDNAPEADGIGFRQEYSLANSSYWYVNEYEGIKLWELLLKSGLKKNAAEEAGDTIVSFVAADGYGDLNTYELREVADYKALGYYEKNSADIKDNDESTPDYVPDPPDADRINLDKDYPVLLAYGVNGYPYVINDSEAGFLKGLDNAGGPLKVIAGKKHYAEANGSRQTQKLEKIVIGGNEYHYSTHKYHENDAYKKLADNEITIKINTISEDGINEYKTKKVTIGEIEELIYGGLLDKGQMAEAKVKAKYDIGGYPEPDIYEGVSLSYFLDEVVGLPGQIGTIIFGNDEETSDPIDLEKLLRMDNGYNNISGTDGLVPALAYAKNGSPLVESKSSEGYESTVTLAEGEDPITVKNKGGPLCLVVPSTTENKIDSYDFSNLTTITINVEADKYAHIKAPYDTYRNETVTVFGAGTRLADKTEFTVDDIESKLKLVVTDDYSIRDENSQVTQVRYRGIKLGEFLDSADVSLKTSASDMIVTYDGGKTATFTYDEYMGTYTNTVTGEKDLKMILAYGSASVDNKDPEDGLPLVENADSNGYDAAYHNAGGPIRLVVGQNNEVDVNAARILDDVTSIEVTAKESASWNHSSKPIFEQYLDDTIKVIVKDKKGTELYKKDYTVKELEDMSSLIEKTFYNESAEYEGLNLWRFITQEVGDIVTLDNVVGIEVASLDGASTDVLDQGKSALVNGISDGAKEKHPILLAYGKNGLPLSAGGKHTPLGPGYDSNIDNKGGPIRLIVYNATGASMSEVRTVTIEVTEAAGGTILAPRFETAIAGVDKELNPAASVRSVKIDKNGGMWIGTYGGGAIYKAYGSDTYVEYNQGNTEGLETSIISAVAPDANGGVWMSQNASYVDPSGNKGVVYLDKDGKITSYTAENTNGNLPDNYVQDIQIDKDGNVWFASFGGITKYDPKADTWKTWTEKDGLPAASVTKIEFDGNGGMWLGCYPNGAGTEESPFAGGFAYMDKDGNITGYQKIAGYDEDAKTSKLADVWVRDIAIDSKGNAWVVASGTNILNNDGGVVWMVEPGKEPVKYTGDQLFGNKLNGSDYAEVRMVAADAYGRLLFGTSHDGILYVQDAAITENGQFKTVVEYSKETGAWDEAKLNNIYSLDVFGDAIYAGGQGGLAWLGEIPKPEVSDKENVGDATAETAEISFVGNGLVKDGYFSIKGLKNAEGIEKGEFTFEWMNSSGSTGTSTAEGAEMRKILKNLLGLTEAADTIKFISSDGQATTMALDDMFTEDKDGQRPVLAWNLDGQKCDPRLIVGQADENDNNRSKWVKDIVKIEVTESGGTQGPDDPVTPPAGDTVGDATAETAEISFVGKGFVKEGYFSIKGLKNAEGIEKDTYEFDWKKSSGATGTSAAEGATMKSLLKDIMGITEDANTIVFTSKDGEQKIMALDDMFAKDKDDQIPVLAWKVDDEKCDPQLVIGQADDDDVNKGKWIKEIVKVEVLETKVAGELDPDTPDEPEVGDTVGDATAETAEISFVGDGLVKEGYFSIKGLKNAEGLETGSFTFEWLNSYNSTGTSTAEGAEMRKILKGLLGLTEEADVIKFISSDGETTTMALDDMFTEDKDGQRPVIAWKLDGIKCNPRLIVGQADENDINRSKWVKDIVKIEVTASYIHQDVLGDDYLDNQEELSEIFDTVEEIKDTLYEEMEALVDYEITKANTAVLEIMLVTEDENGNIVPLDKEHFPEEGLDIYIEYDKIFGGKSADHRNYKYKVLHMFSVDSNGHKAGEIENLDVEITDKGLKVHVKGLSPFAISYEEITPGPELCPVCGIELNADGTCSNAANHNKPPVDDPTDPPAGDDNNRPTDKPEAGKNDKETAQTGDDMNMFAYGAAMILALAGAAAVLYRRREN